MYEGLPYICIISQKQGWKLRWVEFKTTGQNMMLVSKMLTDNSLFRRLNTITSAEVQWPMAFCITTNVG